MMRKLILFMNNLPFVKMSTESFWTLLV